jgi:hypothetical protein
MESTSNEQYYMVVQRGCNCVGDIGYVRGRRPGSDTEWCVVLLCPALPGVIRWAAPLVYTKTRKEAYRIAKHFYLKKLQDKLNRVKLKVLDEMT